MKSRLTPLIVMIVFLAFLMLACRYTLSPPPTSPPGTSHAPDATPIADAGGGWLDWDPDEPWEGADGGRDEVMEGEYLLEEAEPAEAPDMALGGAELESEEVDGMDDQVGQLRAGSVDDNREWDDYLLYRRRFADTGLPVHDLDVSERHVISVSNPTGHPVLGAGVSVYDGDHLLSESHTYADGRALFFPLVSDSPDAQGYHVVVEKGGASAEIDIDRETREHDVTLEAVSATDPVRLDVLFLIDVTGSMGDEIAQLKENMIAVSEQINALPSSPDVRFGMTVYRDVGDAFVSRSYDFTPDVQAFTEALSLVTANGGGDYPEHLSQGLNKAIRLPEWRVEETVSLIFLVADAPPQLHYNDEFDYADEVFEATRRGIKIFPIASSGLDDQGEYIYRQLAQVTMGKFLFLTYGAGGDPSAGPGDETTHHVDDYSVLSLDQLVVKMVEEELAHLSSAQ